MLGLASAIISSPWPFYVPCSPTGGVLSPSASVLLPPGPRTSLTCVTFLALSRDRLPLDYGPSQSRVFPGTWPSPRSPSSPCIQDRPTGRLQAGHALGLVGCVLSRSVMSNSFVTPWPAAHQARLSLEFSRQEY